MSTETTRPYWYEVAEGGIYCQWCRAKMLEEWSPHAVAQKGGTEDEMARPSDFRPLGRTPWAGNSVGERYMQCDNCNGQWGPDA